MKYADGIWKNPKYKEFQLLENIFYLTPKVRQYQQLKIDNQQRPPKTNFDKILR